MFLLKPLFAHSIPILLNNYQVKMLIWNMHVTFGGWKNWRWKDSQWINAEVFLASCHLPGSCYDLTMIDRPPCVWSNTMLPWDCCLDFIVLQVLWVISLYLTAINSTTISFSFFSVSTWAVSRLTVPESTNGRKKLGCNWLNSACLRLISGIILSTVKKPEFVVPSLPFQDLMKNLRNCQFPWYNTVL